MLKVAQRVANAVLWHVQLRRFLTPSPGARVKPASQEYPLPSALSLITSGNEAPSLIDDHVPSNGRIGDINGDGSWRRPQRMIF